MARTDEHEALHQSDQDEFSELLDALGSETGQAVDTPEDPRAREIAMARVTIEELRSTLTQLKPLGDELAATERDRLALETHAEELDALRRATNTLLGEAGRILHRMADERRPLSRRSLRRLANVMAMAQADAWPVLADVESDLDSAPHTT